MVSVFDICVTDELKTLLLFIFAEIEIFSFSVTEPSLFFVNKLVWSILLVTESELFPEKEARVTEDSFESNASTTCFTPPENFTATETFVDFLV